MTPRWKTQFEKVAAKYKPLRELKSGEPTEYRLKGWHATPLENWTSIRRKGLIPGARPPGGQTWLGTWSGKAIYFHLSFPKHELDYDKSTGDPYAVVLEYRIIIDADFVVPDEEFGTPDETAKIVAQKSPVAVGMRIPSNDLLALHLPDTPAARDWARQNAKSKKVVFHHV